MFSNLTELTEQGTVLLVDKPIEWTSFDVVNKIKHKLRHLSQKKVKVGHAGTLDPLATGLLIVCTGPKTKQIDGIQNADKAYLATLRLGQTTASYDAETVVLEEKDTDTITLEQIEKALENFKGTIQQIPPAHSALKIGGKPAYKLARQGKEVELKARELHISHIEVLSFENPVLKLDIVCSKGTYIRSIAHDLGQNLGVGAHLTGLIRTRIGTYRLEEAWQLNDLVVQLDTLAPEKI